MTFTAGISAAMIALEDHEHIRASVARNADDPQEFFNQASARMLTVTDSQANFALLNTGRPAITSSSTRLNRCENTDRDVALMSAGVPKLTRMYLSKPGNGCRTFAELSSRS